MALEFWERVNKLIRDRATNQEWVAGKAALKYQTFRGWVTKDILPRVDEAGRIAQALGTTVEFLLTGKNRPWIDEDACADPDSYPVPILDQKVAAGGGQELLESAQVVGTCPYPKRMFRGENPARACALEVEGDSMTGVDIFDGDLVIFMPGVIRGDGIYVLKVNNALIVKRVQFDEISQTLRITSENPKYPERIESADSQAVEVLGKVYGWVHAHPY